ncbi:hypothetical protein IFR05_003049 [Cadophora sp. M221]|nr:hypothetical protein IFR05_003049 [Cadophora sp. M221]
MSDLDKDLRLLRKLYENFISLKCRDCKSSLSLGSLEKNFKTWLSNAKCSSPNPISGIFCKRCKKYTCIGCRKKPSLGNKPISTPAAQVNNCCDRGRLFGIWILLARFDELEVEVRRDSSKQVQAERAPCQPGEGVGYNQEGLFLLKHVWKKFGGATVDDIQNMPELMTTKEVLKGMQNLIVLDDNYEWDFYVNKVEIARMFQQAVAPSNDTNADLNDHQQNRRDTVKFDLKASFDKHPPVELFPMLILSFLFENVGILLRNDSIEDMTRRSELYHAMLEFVNVMASHKKLIQQLITGRVSIKRSLGLQALATAKSPAKLFNTRPSSLEPSLAACASESYKHAKAFRDLASNPAISKDAPLATPSSKPGDHAWSTYSDSHKVTFSDAVLDEHMCRDQFMKIVESPRGRMAALRNEIASLTTSLPRGIFLKISETRPDVMKALIIGADGTPYEGGLFAFNLFLPQNWPEVPPIFYFAMYMGFDDSTEPNAHINPNIHRDGLVCLSLLNTFRGDTFERWQPNKSTLLSLFVSVAMILGVENPLLNYPWLGDDKKTSELIKYKNDFVQSLTVAYAMV